jgi:type I restriction enzyme R subunit
MMSATGDATSSNFGFLAKRYPQLERVGALAERYFSDDPVVSLITIRQFGEALAQLVWQAHPHAWPGGVP